MATMIAPAQSGRVAEHLAQAWDAGARSLIDLVHATGLRTDVVRAWLEQRDADTVVVPVVRMQPAPLPTFGPLGQALEAVQALDCLLCAYAEDRDAARLDAADQVLLRLAEALSAVMR